MSSTRLPGKVLLSLGTGTVLSNVVARCAKIGVDEICCAVPEGPLHDAVAAEARRSGARVVRGSDADVLDRFAQAAEQCSAGEILRVTADCPLIDPALCGEIIGLRRKANADYASNNMPPGFPHGLDAEAFTAEVLARAAKAARSDADREHVTPWLRRDPTVSRVNLPGPGGGAIEQRWTLDYPADYDFIRAVYARLDPHDDGDWRRTLAAVRREPDLSSINAAHRDPMRRATAV